MAIARSTIAATRYGYGFHPAQSPADGPDALLEQVRGGAAAAPLFPPRPATARMATLQELRRLTAKRNAGGDNTALSAHRKTLRGQALNDVANGLLQRAISPNGAFERLTAFWLDHFAVGAGNVRQMLYLPDFELSAIRPHLSGRFADLLTAAIQHTSMLTYLDQIASFGPTSREGRRRGRGLNENLARELLELHTLGVGGAYTQADVRATAELLTGYAIDHKTGGFKFRRYWAEPGARTVMGRSYGGPRASYRHAEALMADLAVHPDTARHIARKLAVHFVSDTPPEDLVRHIESTWRRSDGDLSAVYGALFEHPASWRDPGGKIKRPEELVVSTLRAGGIGMSLAREMGPRGRRNLVAGLRRLGQNVFRPPSPAGWPEEAGHWITPQGLAARLAFAGKAGQVLARQRQLDPRAYAETALGELMRDDTAFAVRSAPERWEGFAYVIASPEFNRR